MSTEWTNEDDEAEEEEESTQISDGLGEIPDPSGPQRLQACLIVIAGPALGQLIPIQGTVTVGRSDEADVPMRDNEVSRTHIRIWQDQDGVWIRDLGSTNGTFINDQRVDLHLLQDGDKILLGKSSILKFSYQDQLDSDFQHRMYESIVRDAHTKAYNKQFLYEQIKSEFSFSKRHGSPLTILMFDIDEFKELNDNFGHLAGDKILSALAQHVASHLRAEDLLGRYGGEEFLVLSRGNTIEEGLRLGERIRQLAEELKVEHEGEPLSVSVSVGVAAAPDPQIPDATSLIEAADQALYTAKTEGRNRVEARRAAPRTDG